MSNQKQETSITPKGNFKPCPEKLDVLLSTLNLIPPDETLWSLNVGSLKLLENNQRLHFEALRDLTDKIEKYSPEFQNFIYGREVNFKNPYFFYLGFLPDLDYWETFDALKRYEEFNENRHLLKGMINNFSSSSNRVERQMPYLLQPKTRINIDEKGKIHFSSELIEALEGVEISRIRICENCSRIFWQGRTTQKGCNTNCANNIRVKKSRELKRQNRAKYELNSIHKEADKTQKP
jgi:hypothetical protein